MQDVLSHLKISNFRGSTDIRDNRQSEPYSHKIENMISEGAKRDRKGIINEHEQLDFYKETDMDD